MFKQYPPITQREILEAFVRLGHRQTPEQFALTVTHRKVYAKAHSDVSFEDWCTAQVSPDSFNAFKSMLENVGIYNQWPILDIERMRKRHADYLEVAREYNSAYEAYREWQQNQTEAVPIDRNDKRDIAHIRALHKRVLRHAIVNGCECNPEALKAYKMSWYSRTTS